MTLRVLLDAGPLGQVSKPRVALLNTACYLGLANLVRVGGAALQKSQLNRPAAFWPLANGPPCRIITSKANCCSVGQVCTAPMFAAVSAGPCQRSKVVGVSDQKCVAASWARGPVGTAYKPARGGAADFVLAAGLLTCKM